MGRKIKNQEGKEKITRRKTRRKKNEKKKGDAGEKKSADDR